MAEGVDRQRKLLNREIDFWMNEGKYESADRIFDMPDGSSEEVEEMAWQEHCLKRLNAAAWELVKLEGRGAQHPDAAVVNIEDWRKGRG